MKKIITYLMFAILLISSAYALNFTESTARGNTLNAGFARPQTMVFTVNKNITLINFTMNGGSTCTIGYIFQAGTCNILAQNNSAGNTFWFGNFSMIAGTSYEVGCNSTGTITMNYSTAGGFPSAGTAITWTSSSDKAAGCANTDTTNWRIVDTITFSNDSLYPPPPPFPSMNLILPTEGAPYYYEALALNVNTSVLYMGGAINTTHYLYNSTNNLIATNSNVTADYSSYFFNLPIGAYKINATANNGTHSTNSSTRNVYVYNLTPATYSNPSEGQNTTSQYINLTINAASTTPAAAGVNITEYNYTLLNSVGTFLQTINTSKLTYFYLDIYSKNLTPGNYVLLIKTTDTQGLSKNQTKSFNVITNALLNISLKSFLGENITGNASITITNLNNNYTTNKNFTGGSANFDITKNSPYTITTDAQGYAITNHNLTTNNTLNQQYINLTIYTDNSLSVNIYDESTGILLNGQNISITFTGNTEFTNYTTTGTFYIDNLQDGNYTVKFIGGNYSLTQYFITVNNRSTQTLNAFLSLNSQAVTFTILDFDSSAIIPGATFTQSRLINNSWTVIQSKTSDITGRVQVNYLSSVNYQFIVSKTGYQTQIFYLNPIIFSTYNVRLEKITTLTPQNTPDYQGLSVDFSPTRFYNNKTNTFYWIISSPGGTLTTYNLSIQSPGYSNLTTGTNAYGESFTKTFNITGANTSSQVIIAYCYDTTTTNVKCFLYKYEIIGAYNNQSFLGAQERNYNFGSLDGVLIATVITLAVSGLAFSIAGAVAGLPLMLLCLGFFYYIGLITLWGVLPSMLIGIFMILGRTEGG